MTITRRRIDRVRQVRFESHPFPAVGDGVVRDAIQPGRERRAPPFEPAQVRQRAVKDLGGQVLGFATVADPARDESVDTVEVPFVQLRTHRF
jgi:hypothetical protein